MNKNVWERPEHYAALWADDTGKPRDHPEWQKAYDENYNHLKASAPQQPNRNLNQQQFTPMYHGSPHTFNEGDQIEPNHPARFGMTQPGYVYSTHDPNTAAKYARRGQSTTSRNPHVYEVEHTGEYGDDPGSSNSFRSREPLTVKREIPMDKIPNMRYQKYGNLNHGPNYVGQDSEYRSDMDMFDRRWYGE